MEEKKKQKTYYGYTEAKKKSNARYLAKFEEIRIRMQPEEKEEIKRLASAAGKSVNQYVLDRSLGRE